jgi:translation initiation factor 2B subunit (eIF-2B alpha/beta/delta family)
MQMHEDIATRIEEIRNDRVHGAGWIASYGVETLARAIGLSLKENVPAILEEASTVLHALRDARKNMVYVANAAFGFWKDVSKFKSNPDPEEFKREVKEEAAYYVKKMEADSWTAAGNAATAIFKNDTILTCSYSAMMVRTFRAARERNPNFNVMICRSSVNEIQYGARLKEELDRHGISSDIIEDNEIGGRVQSANEIMLGADAVLQNGDIINGTPSRALVEAAEARGLLVFFVCEDAKFDVANAVKNGNLETGLDLVPGKLWTTIITESGRIAPPFFKEHVEYLQKLYSRS